MNFLQLRIPKGLRNKAQGCEERATLGLRHRMSARLKGLRPQLNCFTQSLNVRQTCIRTTNRFAKLRRSGTYIRHFMQRTLSITALLLFCAIESISFANQIPSITLSCSADNDLYVVLHKSGLKPKRFETPSRAIAKAPNDSAVLLLADHYPEQPPPLSPEIFQQASAKHLRLYVEFAAFVPGVTLGAPKTTSWERLIISSDSFGQVLPKGRLLMANDCYIQPTTATEPLVVSGRVAGYDTAVYGIPDSAQPILFTQDNERILVSTTKLSGFVKGRFAPSREWNGLWTYILERLTQTKIPQLKWTRRATPTYGLNEILPAHFEDRAFRRAVNWIYESRLLLTPDNFRVVTNLLKQKAETSKSWKNNRAGDGSHGILEGYSSAIDHDGNQPQRLPLRADCQAESAMVLALEGALHSNRTSRITASNLLDFLYFNSDLCKGPRGDLNHPSFGLISWGNTTSAWKIANYGDNNARVMLATMLAAANLHSDRWDESLLRALMANLRTTGKLGFRGDRIDMPELEKHGWRHFHDRDITNYSPPFEAYNWACFLWAYRQIHEREFLEKTKTAISMTMKAFPDKWRWNDNSERARMLLCLAWLVRLEDTEEHRLWARQIADELIAIQDVSGAIPERFRGAEGSHYQIPKSNAAYGTGETPLLQQNGDPVSDQLYVTGFTLLAFHETAGALNDPKIRAAEDKLANYLCRIQIHSPSLSYLDGTWFRAFDFARWEPWASSGDFGWGAWSVEAGWGQAWTAAVLALREQHTTLWDSTSHSRIGENLAVVQKQMAVNNGEPLRSPNATSHP